MHNVSFRKLICPTLMVGLLTSCNNIETPPSSFEPATTTTAETTTTIDEDALIPFDDFEVFEEDGEYYFTINQEGMEGCYYTISVFYGNKAIEYVSGDGYLKSAYGEFFDDVDETSSDTTTTDKHSKDDDDNDETSTTTEVTTISTEELVGKDGKWTFKCVAEGTDYVEIKLINEYGDVRFKCQYTCIVDTHMEAHMYYTNINY